MICVCICDDPQQLLAIRYFHSFVRHLSLLDLITISGVGVCMSLCVFFGKLRFSVEVSVIGDEK